MSTDLAAEMSRAAKLGEIQVRYRAVRKRIEAERAARWRAEVEASRHRVWVLMDGLDVTPGPVARVVPALGAPESHRCKAVARLTAELETAAANLRAIQEWAEAAWADARAHRAQERAPFNFTYTATAA